MPDHEYVLAQVCEERSKSIGREVGQTKQNVDKLFCMANSMHTKIVATLVAALLLLVGVIVNISIVLGKG